MTKLENDDWYSQVRRGVLELGILALLEMGPSYGYEIVSHLSSYRPLSVGEGTIYPILRRLRSAGYLETYWQESEAGPPRRYYTLTAMGQGRIRNLRHEWEELRETMEGLLGRKR